VEVTEKSRFPEVVAALPHLSRVELDQLALRLQALRGGSKLAKIVNKNQSPDDWLLHGVELELRRMGISNKYLVRGWKTFAASYGERAEAIREKLEQHMGEGMTQAEKIALGRMAARALADYLRPIATISPKLMLSNIDKVLVALDQSYPDYLRTGMLRFLLHRNGGEPSG
jgi:predicted secreted protein